MRFIHTADLHLGRKLSQMSLQEDFEYVFSQLEALVEQARADALVVAGDVYETANPTDAAARQWNAFLTRMAARNVSVLVVGGDHDSGARLSVGSSVIAKSGIHIVGELMGKLRPVVIRDVNFWLVPFMRPSDVRAWALSAGLNASPVENYDAALRFVLDRVRHRPEFAERPNVCVAHQLVCDDAGAPQRSDSEHHSLGGRDSVDWKTFEGFDYVALGHVHMPQHVGTETIRYAGSPLKLSASEIDQQKSFVVVGVKRREEGTRTKYKLVPVKPLHEFRQEHGSLDELVARGEAQDEAMRQDYVHAIVTDEDPTDALMRLRSVWPNLEQVTFENAGTKAAEVDDAPQELDLDKSMADLFCEFFEAQTGKPLMAHEAKLVNATLDAVLAKGGDAS